MRVEDGRGGFRLPVGTAAVFEARPRSSLPWLGSPCPLIKPGGPVSSTRFHDWLRLKVPSVKGAGTECGASPLDFPSQSLDVEV